MRPVEFSDEAIIQAGQALRQAGRNVTGFALRQKIGGGSPTRLRQVWDDHLSSLTETPTQPVAELPTELAQAVASLTQTVNERIMALVVELNQQAIQSAEGRVQEVLRTSDEQQQQAKEELAEAASAVSELDTQIVAAQTEVETLTSQLTASQAQLQTQAIELAQLRERLAAAEEAGRAAAQAHAAELAQSRDTAERLRAELDTLRETSANELKMVWQELASAKATAENDVCHARDEALRHQQAVDQVNGLLVQLRNELAQACELAAAAREEAAGLRGRVEAVDSQRAELLQVLAGRTQTGQVQADLAL
ncbi:MAG: DNA-binding protein [Macromonas sp.]